MPITTVKEQFNTVYEGLIYGRTLKRRTVTAAERIYFGKAVSLDATDDISKPDPAVNLFTDTETFYGISIADVTLEALPAPDTGQTNGAPFGAFEPKKGFAVVKKGSIWVVSDTAVTSRALGVYIRDEDNAGTPATITSTTATLANLADDSFTVTIAGYAVQTITFGAVAPASVAAACATINAQLEGAIAAPSGTDIVITTKMVGSTITIAATAVGTDLVWDTPVAGTGEVASYAWNSRGSFRAYTTGQSVAGFTEVTAGLKWVAAQTTGGKYYGLLDVDI